MTRDDSPGFIPYHPVVESDWHPLHGVETQKFAVRVERYLKTAEDAPDQIVIQYVLGTVDIRVGDRLLRFLAPWLEGTYNTGTYSTVAQLDGEVVFLGTGEDVPEAVGFDFDGFVDKLALSSGVDPAWR